MRLHLCLAFVALPACRVHAPILSERPRLVEGGFPAQVLKGIVYAQARFDVHHERTFGLDLASECGVLPIALSVRLRGQGQEVAQALLNAERMNPRLYLQDGTPLAPVDVDALVANLEAKHATRIREQALRGRILSADAEERYLYFALAPSGELELDGATVIHRADGERRELPVTSSLLAFTVNIEGRETPFYLGVGH